jgi:hypothetical protein
LRQNVIRFGYTGILLRYPPVRVLLQRSRLYRRFRVESLEVICS